MRHFFHLAFVSAKGSSQEGHRPRGNDLGRALRAVAGEVAQSNADDRAHGLGSGVLTKRRRERWEGTGGYDLGLALVAVRNDVAQRPSDVRAHGLGSGVSTKRRCEQRESARGHDFGPELVAVRHEDAQRPSDVHAQDLGRGVITKRRRERWDCPRGHNGGVALGGQGLDTKRPYPGLGDGGVVGRRGHELHHLRGGHRAFGKDLKWKGEGEGVLSGGEGGVEETEVYSEITFVEAAVADTEGIAVLMSGRV